MAFKKVRKPKQAPKKRVKVQALFWLEPAMAKILKKEAKRLGISQSELARAVFAYIEIENLWGRFEPVASE